MKLLLIGLLSLSQFAFGNIAAKRAACNNDNCARAVTGTTNGLAAQSSHRQDCSSFLSVTVTPATFITTPTVTVYHTVPSSTVSLTFTFYSIVSPGVTPKKARDVNQREAGLTPLPLPPMPTLMARQVTVSPSSVPRYASSCSGAVRYSSACSCFGVTAATTTAATPTYVASAVTVTSPTTSGSVTATATVTVAVCDPASNNGYNYADGILTSGPNQSGFAYTVTTHPDLTNIHDCCVGCFSSQDCLAYTLSYQNTCTFYVDSSTSNTEPVAYAACPAGLSGVSGEQNFGSAGAYGFGPCEVNPFP